MGCDLHLKNNRHAESKALALCSPFHYPSWVLKHFLYVSDMKNNELENPRIQKFCHLHKHERKEGREKGREGVGKESTAGRGMGSVGGYKGEIKMPLSSKLLLDTPKPTFFGELHQGTTLCLKA